MLALGVLSAKEYDLIYTYLYHLLDHPLDAVDILGRGDSYAPVCGPVLVPSLLSSDRDEAVTAIHGGDDGLVECTSAIGDEQFVADRGT